MPDYAYALLRRYSTGDYENVAASPTLEAAQGEADRLSNAHGGWDPSSVWEAHDAHGQTWSRRLSYRTSYMIVQVRWVA